MSAQSFSSPEILSRRIEDQAKLLNTHHGFSQTYVTLQYINDFIDKTPSKNLQSPADALMKMIRSTRFESKKQSFFLYSQAAEILIRMSQRPTNPSRAQMIESLQQMLKKANGKKQRALSEALGSLPLKIKGPEKIIKKTAAVMALSFQRIFEMFDMTHLPDIQWHGRTLRLSLPDSRCCCIKFARTKTDIPCLTQEISWLLFFGQQQPEESPANGHIPEPILVDNHCLFCLEDFPEFIKKPENTGILNTAMIYLADPEYFHYPNDPDCFALRLSSVDDRLKTVFKKNARLLGQMAAGGIIHTALIPLFHNRIQQERRQDGGFYVWEMGGRLDRWLESSQYPNFAKSGLRDFEHLLCIKDTKQLRHHIGEHILGFVLVLGSCFRNRDARKMGWKKDGTPIDTRHLFDKDLFKSIFIATICEYYAAITGVHLKNAKSLVTDALIDELVDKMGIDRDMTEMLRRNDQENMSEKEFQHFLTSRGLSEKDICVNARGAADIVLHTGPHLGGFNQPISVPLLIQCLFCLSSLCISDRYVMENGLKAVLN